jgi:hypothetical protein
VAWATDGLAWLYVTQSTAAMMVEYVPDPAQSRARTEYSVTPFATPTVVPPIVPAMCVLCPLQSAAGPPGVTRSTPVFARFGDAPSNSVCVNRIPVPTT